MDKLYFKIPTYIFLDKPCDLGKGVRISDGGPYCFKSLGQTVKMSSIIYEEDVNLTLTRRQQLSPWKMRAESGDDQNLVDPKAQLEEFLIFWHLLTREKFLLDEYKTTRPSERRPTQGTSKPPLCKTTVDVLNPKFGYGYQAYQFKLSLSKAFERYLDSEGSLRGVSRYFVFVACGDYGKPLLQTADYYLSNLYIVFDALIGSPSKHAYDIGTTCEPPNPCEKWAASTSWFSIVHYESTVKQHYESGLIELGYAEDIAIKLAELLVSKIRGCRSRFLHDLKFNYPTITPHQPPSSDLDRIIKHFDTDNWAMDEGVRWLEDIVYTALIAKIFKDNR